MEYYEAGSFRAQCEQSARDGVLGIVGFGADLRNADAFSR